MGSIKVLTLNIHKGFSSGNLKFTLGQIRENLRNSGCSLVFLQEVIGENEKHRSKIAQWPEENQFEYLADSVWSHYAYGKNAIYQHGHHGNAILSELPIVRWNNEDISLMSFSQRGILHGELDNGVHLLCIHMGLFEKERQHQTAKLRHYIERCIPRDAPLILCGDFNDWRKTVHKNILSSTDLNEAYETRHGKLAKSYPSIMPSMPMDRIYYRGFSVKDCQLKREQTWRALSDHCAITAELEILDSKD